MNDYREKLHFAVRIGCSIYWITDVRLGGIWVESAIKPQVACAYSHFIERYSRFIRSVIGFRTFRSLNKVLDASVPDQFVFSGRRIWPLANKCHELAPNFIVSMHIQGEPHKGQAPNRAFWNDEPVG